jgi:protein tyrosine phosphatase (PTP) superfamily phosphohydrolase (DUF442 family)
MKKNLTNDKLKAIYQYRRLSESIATSGQPSEAQFEDVAKAGFNVIINLGLTDSDYSLEDERSLIESLGLAYEHIPVAWDRPTRNDLERFFLTMEKYNGKRLFIHCAANMRVSVFMALFRIMKEDWPREEAMKSLQQVWLPNAIWKRFIDKSLSRP